MKVIIPVTIAFVLIGIAFGGLAEAELLFHYSFENEQLEDDSGKNNLAEVRGSTKWVPGRIGMGLEFNGEDCYIFTAGEGIGPLMFMHDAFSERSVAMWIETADVSVDQTILDEGGTSNGYCVKINEGTLQICTTNGGVGASATADYKDTNWHHIAAVYKEGELNLYIDGEKVATEKAPYQQVDSHANDGAIGASFDGDGSGGGSNGIGAWNFFTGVMDEIYFYDNAIAEEEIKSLYLPGALVEYIGKLAARWGKIKSN